MAARISSTVRAIVFPLLVTIAFTQGVGSAAAQNRAAGRAATTRLLPVSGVLTDAGGNPRSGAAIVTFGLYDAQENGTLLWTEVQEVQADARGRYSALIDGSGTPGQIAKFTTASDVASSIISETAAGRIGIGLTDPTGGTVVDSRFTVQNLDNNTGIAVLNESNARRFALNTLATGAWLAYDGGSGVWNPGLSQLGGRVGIGTASPETTLHVGTPLSNQTPILKIDGAFNTAGQGTKLRWSEVFTADFGFEAYLESDVNTLTFRAIEDNLVTADNLLVFTRAAPNNIGVGTATPAEQAIKDLKTENHDLRQRLELLEATLRRLATRPTK